MLIALIVDDDERNRKLARDVLRAAGFDTIEASDGAEAITLAAEHLPDVVLLDLRLPDIGGAEVARRLGDDERTIGIPVVAMSASPLEGSDDWLAGAGFAGFIGKPIDVGAFPDRVKRFCTRPDG